MANKQQQLLQLLAYRPQHRDIYVPEEVVVIVVPDTYPEDDHVTELKHGKAHAVLDATKGMAFNAYSGMKRFVKPMIIARGKDTTDAQSSPPPAPPTNGSSGPAISQPPPTAPETILLPSDIGILPKGHLFSVFKTKHANEAAAAYNHLISLDTYDEFYKTAEYMKGILNENIWTYALSVAWLHRNDTKAARFPPIWEYNARSFFHSRVIDDAISRDPGTKPAAVPFITGTHKDTEFKMAWWREDCGLNAHHTYWHQVYPWAGKKDKESDHPKTQDRQGELFYYMHQQMLARYDAERIAVGLPRVEPFLNWQQPIQEGYNSQLTDAYGKHHYSPRPAGMVLADSWRDSSAPVLIIQQEYHRNRILDAINTGQFTTKDNTSVPVDINLLGAAVESNIDSPNMQLYGSIHNYGHDLISIITDPDGRYSTDRGAADGVMGDPATAIRDPIFFRWHKFVDTLFFLHKITLHQYSDEELDFKDVTVNSIQVQRRGSSEESVLTTYMEDVEVDISHSMKHVDRPNTSVNVLVKQVNHEKFDYTVKIYAEKAVKAAAIRIFMAPSQDIHGQEFPFDVQRRLFIEMDKFVKELAEGNNTIVRSSTDSSVVKPPDIPWKKLAKMTAPDNDDCQCGHSDRYCGCGWPQHMLLPRGLHGKGMPFDLFVMVTDWSKEKRSGNNDLDQGSSYCGTTDSKYPDGRAMGFPFDRKFKYAKVADFTKRHTNMATVPIRIARGEDAPVKLDS